MADSEERFFIISMDKIDDTQRKLVQVQVNEHAVSWWHQQQNLWVVEGGEGAGYWRDLLKPFVNGVPGDLYVFQLPAKNGRSFASFGPSTHAAWLRATYMGRGEIESPK